MTEAVDRDEATDKSGVSDRWLARLDGGLFRFELLTGALAAWVIFFVMVLGVAEILSRSLLNNPIYGQLDLIILSGPIYGILGISYCYRRASHVRMDLLARALSGRTHWIVELIVSIACWFIVLILIQGSWQHFMRAYEIGDSTINTRWPTWPSKLLVPLGLAILWLRLTLELWVYGRLVVDPDLQPIGVPTPPDPTAESVD